MLYVLDQRLKAQDVSADRATRVLNEIAAIMLNEKFLDKLFEPQKVYNKHAIYILFSEIANSSIMKLTDLSMSKLYDLMVMVFKYQLLSASQPNDMLFITLNHLDSMRRLISSNSVNGQLDAVYCMLLQRYEFMNEVELQRIRYDSLRFLQDIHIKVSVFIRHGLQNDDGTFVIPLNTVIASDLERPGLIKIFDYHGQLNDVIDFSSGGEYTISSEKGTFDINGRRGTKLGTTIYLESPPDSEEENELRMWGTTSLFRNELHVLLTQLLGDSNRLWDQEFLQLDLFDHQETRTTEMKVRNMTIMEIDGKRKENNLPKSLFKSIDNERNTQTQCEDVLHLLNSLENEL